MDKGTKNPEILIKLTVKESQLLPTYKNIGGHILL